MDSASYVDIRDVLRGLRSRWLSIVVFTAVCGVLAYLFVNAVTPVYTAGTQVLIANQETPYTRVAQDRVERTALSERDITSQVQVVKSRDLAVQVVKDLGLSKVAEFDPLKSGIGTVGNLLIKFGFKQDPRKMTEQQRVLDSYFEKLTVFQVTGSSVLTIQFTAENPKLAQAVANKVAEHYVSFSKQALNEPTGAARDWLASQIEDLRKKVVVSETAVERFKAKAGIFRGAQAKLDSEELSSLNSQIIVASAAHSEAQAKAASIRDLLKKTGTVATSADVLASPLIQRLREQQVTLTRSRAELSTIYLDNHPRIIAVNRELQDLNRQIRSEAFKVVQRLEQDARVAAEREKSLRGRLNKLKGQTSRAGIDHVKLRELEREAKANRSLLESFLVRYTDANSRQDTSTQPGLGRIISAAGLPPQPSFPKKGPIMLLATVGGFMLALGLAFVAEVMASAGQQAGLRAQAARDERAPNAEPGLSVVAADAAAVSGAQSQSFGTHINTNAATAAAPAVHLSSAAQAPQPGVVVSSPVAQAPAAAAAAAAAGPVAATSGGAVAVLPAVETVEQGAKLAGLALLDPANGFANALKPVVEGIRHLAVNGSAGRLTVVNLTGNLADSQTATLALGRMLAQSGCKTLAIDCNETGGGLDALEPALSGTGLLNVIAKQAELTTIVRKDPQSALHVVVPGMALPQANAVAAMDQAISTLSPHYNLCLVHLGQGNDTNVSLAANSDIVLVLAAEDRMPEAREVCNALKSGRVKEAEIISVRKAGAQPQATGFRNIAATL